MTERLFDHDVHLMDFTAHVISCEEKNGQYLVVLDRTAFFPEGGGQGADHGTLGTAQVLDVHESHGVITHTLDQPLTAGEAVDGHVAWERRLSMMQQHSGEHIFTGIIHGKYGYDNVGFHIGTDAVTVDFNGPLTLEQVREAERLANEVIWRNTPIRAWFPSKEELDALDYRSKKAIEGDLRIVRVEGVDTCACCGTHVETAGSVGQIKVINMMNYKGGVRVFILCGMRALDAMNTQLDENRAVSQALSAKPGSLKDAVARLMTERDQLKARCAELGMLAFTAAAQAETGDIRIVVGDMLSPAQVRDAATKLAQNARCGLVLIPKGDGWSYALCACTEDARPAAKALNERFGGKGGGPREMVQGMLNGGTVEEIRALLNTLAC